MTFVITKATKMLFCTSATVVGWQALRYFYGHRLASADRTVEQASVRDKKAYRRATERWENEGGATLAGQDDLDTGPDVWRVRVGKTAAAWKSCTE